MIHNNNMSYSKSNNKLKKKKITWFEPNVQKNISSVERAINRALSYYYTIITIVRLIFFFLLNVATKYVLLYNVVIQVRDGSGAVVLYTLSIDILHPVRILHNIYIYMRTERIIQLAKKKKRTNPHTHTHVFDIRFKYVYTQKWCVTYNVGDVSGMPSAEVFIILFV